MTVFGQDRGTEGVWPGERGFVDGTVDETTGLTQLGERAYDADLGRFVSVDPLMDLTDSRAMNGYVCSNNSPATCGDRADRPAPGRPGPVDEAGATTVAGPTEPRPVTGKTRVLPEYASVPFRPRGQPHGTLQQQGMHARLGEIAALSALLDVVLLREQARWPAGGAVAFEPSQRLLLSSRAGVARARPGTRTTGTPLQPRSVVCRRGGTGGRSAPRSAPRGHRPTFARYGDHRRSGRRAARGCSEASAPGASGERCQRSEGCREDSEASATRTSASCAHPTMVPEEGSARAIARRASGRGGSSAALRASGVVLAS
ncbi:RHS repeat-associated core domain-containing protein [Nocardiopsis kunsanensis]|uniref:RHS repeat-associated core domain-containing protein n=1 Tax=Nocardiopsis kunsanensis TaxID=141693 RepID=UPI00373AF435